MSSEHKGRRQRARNSVSERLRSYRKQRKAWIAGMTRSQRIRHRLLQGAVIASILIIILGLSLRAWIRMPEIPGQGSGVITDDGTLSLDGAENPSITQSGRKDGVYTFLVVGRDTAGGGNTDTMMLVTYDTVGKTLNSMSLPRDTMVNVSTSNKKLNAIYNYNRGKDKATRVKKGTTALKKEVSKLTGILPDYYVMLEWDAVGELVNALGGIWFDVPFDMDYDDPTPGQDLHIHQAAGYRKLSGDDAMQVIRHRKNNDGSHSGGDVARLEIQQSFLKAVAKECLQPKTLLKAPSLAKIFMDNVTTDLSLGNLLAFAQLAYGMDAENNVSFVTMPYMAYSRGASYVLPVADELLTVLNADFNPYLTDIQSSDLELLYLNKDGSMGVTRGTLADSSLAKPRSASHSKPAEKVDPNPTVPSKPETPGTTPPPEPVAPIEPKPDVSTPGSSQEPTKPDQSTPSPGGAASQPETPSGSGSQAGGSASSGEVGGGTELPDWLNPAA